jgi:16S rRNA (cytosine967-C5)-methyltransferase
MAIDAAAKAGLVSSPIAPAELPTLEAAITPEGHARILPGMWADIGGLDGFFIARFTKPAGD